jgi:hypothetical protein
MIMEPTPPKSVRQRACCRAEILRCEKRFTYCIHAAAIALTAVPPDLTGANVFRFMPRIAAPLGMSILSVFSGNEKSFFQKKEEIM